MKERQSEQIPIQKRVITCVTCEGTYLYPDLVECPSCRLEKDKMKDTKFGKFQEIFYEEIHKHFEKHKQFGMTSAEIKQVFKEATRQTREHFKLKAELEELKKYKEEVERQAKEEHELAIRRRRMAEGVTDV